MRIFAIIAFSFALATGGGAAAEDKIRIALFGDSLSAGYGLPAEEGLAAALQKELGGRGLSATVINAGVAGETSADGLRRVDWMLRAKPDLAVVQFGANDMFRNRPVAAIEKNLAGILHRLKQRKVPALLAGMRAPINHPSSYRREFSAMYRRLSEEWDTPLYPFFLEGVALRPSLNLSDGIHPNAAGVRRIAENIAPSILQALRRE